MSFDVGKFTSKVSLDVQAGLITVEEGNALVAKAQRLADKNGNLGAKDRIELRYGVGASGARETGSGGGSDDGGSGDGTPTDAGQGVPAATGT